MKGAPEYQGVLREMQAFVQHVVDKTLDAAIAAHAVEQVVEAPRQAPQVTRMRGCSIQ